ncbi:MAG TPA: (d)CMP kinase [Dehalococcoidia bacterium]|nr:(d)CMP kinase [Dehalococcoidia bacterium]
MGYQQRRRIAIDGPAASGKSAVGSAVARALGFPFIDTGGIYRALTWLALNRRIQLSDAKALTTLASTATVELGPAESGSETGAVVIDGLDATPHLRNDDVEQNVSVVSAVPGVRRHLVSIQRRLADGCAVMAGRDIGSVVLPDADLKTYLDASPEERARRRRDQLLAAGEQADYSLLVEQMRRRDHLDSSRAVAPLQVPEGAVRLQTDGMSLDEVIARILGLYVERFGETRSGLCGSAGPGTVS